MFRRVLRPILTCPRPNVCAFFASGPILSSTQPNAPLELDPSLRALLKDVDMSIFHHKTQPHKHTELQVLPGDQPITREADAYGDIHRQQRKSPAAHFGSQRIGTVILPFELQKSIGLLISDSDKHQLRNDAKRLFHDPEEVNNSESQWDAQYDVEYRSRRQAERHSERDGAAFASIALPAHYSAICSVLNHVKTRLGPDWNVQSVIDWGAGTGSGLWASLHSFQQPLEEQDESVGYEPQISRSSVTAYLGLDKRGGLVSVGKRLLRDVNLGPLNVSWQKSFRENDRVHRSDGYNVLAMSAFFLSSLPSPKERKAMVKEMWESGARVMILIDHNTKMGFDGIAEAREYLLNAGRNDIDDITTKQEGIHGSHVIAPCPHDSACPLHRPGATRLVCGFSQRLQRPPFIRMTKHSGVGHEDIEYSYVVVQRGSRPISHTRVGRLGEVGKWAIEKEASRRPMRELTLHDNEVHTAGTELPYATTPSESIDLAVSIHEPESAAELHKALRLEAFSWPRIIFPPLKRSGHIILDSCTAEGKIMRCTIPKSQGKQEFYDARKSTWGDIFPHEPKNPPQEHDKAMRAKGEGGTKPTTGRDNGTPRGSSASKQQPSYAAVSRTLKREKRRKDRIRAAEGLQEEASTVCP